MTWTKQQTFCRWYFQINDIDWKCLKFHWNMFFRAQYIIGWGDCLVPSDWKSLTHGKCYDSATVSLDHDVLNLANMMTSSNGNIFRVTGHLCGEFTGPRWIPCTKASDTELWCFFDLRPKKLLTKQSWGWWFETPSHPLWRHRNEIAHLFQMPKWYKKYLSEVECMWHGSEQCKLFGPPLTVCITL